MRMPGLPCNAGCLDLLCPVSLTGEASVKISDRAHLILRKRTKVKSAQSECHVSKILRVLPYRSLIRAEALAMRSSLSRFALLLACLAGTLAGCTDKPADHYPGYAEADLVRLSSPIGGTLAALHVQRGTQIAAGEAAFALEQDNERSARLQAQAHLQRAQANLADLGKGRRPDELAVLDQQLAQANAALALSRAALARETQLLNAKFIAPARVDEARAAQSRDQARVAEVQAQLRVARLGGRSDAMAAAAQEVQAAQAEVAQAEWRLAQKTVKAPLAGSVTEVLYREGELVAAGMPVVGILAPEHMRARFFVPEPVLGTLKLGQAVSLACDGCKGPIAATISFIGSTAEYTAPLIYSKENRTTLVFMIEARPAPGALLHPGQPLEVRMAAKGTP
jgi:HlyD family secretion protein